MNHFIVGEEMDEQERKARGKAAIERYMKRQEPKVQGPKRKNEKPEKDVEKACLKWMRERGWNVQIYESKAVYSESAGRYISQNMKAGNTDCMGTLPNGIGVYVEFKAKGRRSQFASFKNHRQQEFVQQKIEAGGFACVVDSPELLESIFEHWMQLRMQENSQLEHTFKASKEYLMSQVPKRTREEYDEPLFGDD